MHLQACRKSLAVRVICRAASDLVALLRLQGLIAGAVLVALAAALEVAVNGTAPMFALIALAIFVVGAYVWCLFRAPIGLRADDVDGVLELINRGNGYEEILRPAKLHGLVVPGADELAVELADDLSEELDEWEQASLVFLHRYDAELEATFRAEQLGTRDWRQVARHTGTLEELAERVVGTLGDIDRL